MKLRQLFVTLGLALAVGLGIGAGLNIKQEAKEVKADDDITLGKDRTIIIATKNDYQGYNTFYDDDIGVYYWSSTNDALKGTVAAHQIANTRVCYATVPANATNMQILRLSSSHPTLPIKYFPTGYVDNQFDGLAFQDRRSVVEIYGWGTGDRCWRNDCDRLVLPEKMPVFVKFESGTEYWFEDSEICLYHALPNEFYGYNSYTAHETMTRIGNTSYCYFIPTGTIIADRIVISRKMGSNYWVNQTTDILTYHRYYNTTLLKVSNSQDGSGHYNWESASMSDTADAYGELFLNSITCGGTTGERAGTITSDATAWTNVKKAYQGLSDSVQGLVWSATASESGTAVQKAAYRYDYIVFKKQYAGYDDFATRSTSEGRAFRTISSLPVASVNNTALIISIVSVISLIALDAYFLIRKRKEVK